MDERLRPQSDRALPEADRSSPRAPGAANENRPTAVLAVGISDSIADVLGQFPRHAGHDLWLAIPPGSALFLTAAEFRALKDSSDHAGITTTVETEDPLRRQLAEMFGLRTVVGGTPAGPRLVRRGAPENASPRTPPVPITPIKPGQLVPLPASPLPTTTSAEAADGPPASRWRRTNRTATVTTPKGVPPSPLLPNVQGAHLHSGASAHPALAADGEDRASQRRRTVLIVVAALLGLLLLSAAGLVAASLTLTTTDVAIVLRRQPVSTTAQVIIVPNGEGAPEGQPFVSGQSVTVDVVVVTSAPATGTDVIGVTPASGMVQLANPTDEEVPIAVGTTGTGDTGIEFTFVADVIIPAATATEPGVAEADIETVTLGSRANLEAGDLSGVLDSGVYFSNRLGALAGGTDEDGRVVSEADVLTAVDAAPAALTAAAIDAFAATLQPSVRAIPSTFASEETSSALDHEVGDAAEAVTRRGVYTVTALTYTVTELEAAVAPAQDESAFSSIPNGMTLDPASIKLGVPEVAADASESGDLLLTVPLTGFAVASISEDRQVALIDRLLGTSDRDAEQILMEEPSIAAFTITHTPSWLARGIPDDRGRIDLLIDE